MSIENTRQLKGYFSYLIVSFKADDSHEIRPRNGSQIMALTLEQPEDTTLIQATAAEATLSMTVKVYWDKQGKDQPFSQVPILLKVQVVPH